MSSCFAVQLLVPPPLHHPLVAAPPPLPLVLLQLVPQLLEALGPLLPLRLLSGLQAHLLLEDLEQLAPRLLA
jgi:hypothetical protein